MMLPTLQCCVFLACIFLRHCLAFKNDATEILYSHVVKPAAASPSNSTLNQARHGGRHPGHDPAERHSRHQMGCRELRSTKYISDGQCTSISPLKELVCAGECLPLPVLPNWIGGGYGLKYWSRRSAQEWRCVNDKSRTQRIQLQCQDGTTRTYKVTVVTSCKCKRYTGSTTSPATTMREPHRSRPTTTETEKTRQAQTQKRETPENPPITDFLIIKFADMTA